MNFATRLYASFGLVLLLMVLTTIVGIVNVANTDRQLAQVSDVDSAEQRYAINFRGSVHDRAISIRDAVLTDDARARAAFYQEIEELKTFYAESARELDYSFANLSEPSREARELLRGIQEIERTTLQVTERLIALINQGDLNAARVMLLRDVSPAYSEWLKRINALIDYQEAQITAQITDVRDATSGFTILMVIVTLIAVVIGVVVSLKIVTSLTRTIGGEPEEAVELISKIAKGDLTVRVTTKHQKSIMAAVARLAKDLNLMIREMNGAADDLAAASSQLSNTAEDNNRAAEEQQRLTENGASAIQQMANTVDEVARHTVEAAQVAGDAQEEFAKGEREVSQSQASINTLAVAVRDAAQGMEELLENSRSIGTVISVIEGIAEQTNLLALNAAIEAARAGEHGRGFAVVADEVRGLATRTQDSTREIQKLIETMQSGAQNAAALMQRGEEQTGISVEQAQRAGEALKSINSLVQKLNDMNAQIATAAEQQSVVAEEISGNFTGITDKATISAAGSRQVDASSKELQQLALTLQQRVRKFSVNH